MIRTTRRMRLPAALLGAALVLAACGGERADETAEEPAADASADAGADAEAGASADDASTDAGQSPGVEIQSSGDPYADAKAAAEHVEAGAETIAGGVATAADVDGDVSASGEDLHATLAALLQEHVYLAGYAVDAAYAFGPDSGEFELAAGALDANTTELADLVGTFVSDEQREAFASLWREHIGFFVDYAVATAGDDEDGRQQALDSLDGYTQQAGAFFEEATGGELPADAVASSLEEHIATLTTAIDALAAGDASAFDDLKAAADHVVSGAGTLAGGIATAIEADGDPASQAGQLRTALATSLQEHVYLAGLAVKTAYAEGADSAAFEAASGTLDANSVELADGIGQLVDDEQREAFLSLWRDHIGFFVDYAVATAGDDDAGRHQAVDQLLGYTLDAGAFFEESTGGELPADAIAGELETHIATLAGAIDSLDAAINGGESEDADSAGGGDGQAAAPTGGVDAGLGGAADARTAAPATATAVVLLLLAASGHLALARRSVVRA